MRKKKITVTLLTAMLVTLSGCVENPNTSVAQNRNMDSVIKEAENTEQSANNYADVAKEVEQNANHYEKKIEEESLGVTVSVDAEVIVPKTSKLSVFRVSQKKVSQEFLDKVRETLTPDITYYDGNILNKQTKTDLAREIELGEAYIESIAVGENGIPDQKTADSLKETYREEICELQQEYESAPDKLNVSAYLSDNTIHSVAENYENCADSFYEWYYSLNTDGENYYGISDGLNGNYCSLFVQNSLDYGNCLRFRSSKNGYIFATAAVVEDDITDQLAKNNEKPDVEDTQADLYIYEDEEATISEQEAKMQADQLMENIGLTEYTCCEGGLYFQNMDLRWKSIEDKALDREGYSYRKVYEFLYMRNIDGIFVDNRTGTKITDDWQDDSYVKKLWGGEAVLVCVNDEGVVDFCYCSPISIDETVVENASIKSFEEIKNTFERMAVIENASEENGEVSIEITSVELVYARISEKDNFDAGILVPVWDFKGKKIDEYGVETEGSIISINAIDGSIIDWELGY